MTLTGKLSWPMKYCRGNLEAYRDSRFITKITADYVDFSAPAGASWMFLATPGEYRAMIRSTKSSRRWPK